MGVLWFLNQVDKSNINNQSCPLLGQCELKSMQSVLFYFIPCICLYIEQIHDDLPKCIHLPDLQDNQHDFPSL